MIYLMKLSISALNILLWQLLIPVKAFLPSQMPSTGARWKTQRMCPLYSSRMPDEGSYWEKYSGGSKEEKELKRMSYEQEEEDAYYGGKSEKNRYIEEDDYDDDFEDEYDEEEDEEDENGIPDPGNYWSNPSRRMDRPIPMKNRRRSRQSPNSNSAEPRRRPPSRKSFAGNGQRPPPKPARDFYERLFWYGFDPDDSEEVGDKTVFGGTKGKFNGLSYVAASEEGPDGGSYRRQLPPSRREYYDNRDDDDELDDDLDDEEGESDEEYNEISNLRPRSVKPPNDFPYPRSEPREPTQTRGRRRQSRRRPEYDDEVEYDDNDNSNGWISKSVSSWFSGNDEDVAYDNNRSRRRQSRKKNSPQWSPFDVVNAFFGVDRDDMQYKADLYNEKMGLGKSRPSSSKRRERPPSSRDTPRRPGYAYRYNGDDDDDLNQVVEIETPTSSVDPSTTQNGQAATNGTEQNGASPAGRQKREKSWEERSLAVERVPPADIPAWGPSGELSYDARTKAIIDALEDIQTAKQKVKGKEKKEALAMEEITILKVDAELQRRNMEDSRGDPRVAQEQLRQIDFELDDASRDLRRARAQVGLVRDRLERLEDRHWALLGYYNPDQAEEHVEAALRELEELEPAAKLNGTGDEVPEKVELAQNKEIPFPDVKKSVDVGSD